MSESEIAMITKNFTEPELWVWNEIKVGRIADFNKRYANLDPKSENNWNNPKEDRNLSNNFLLSILTEEKVLNVISTKGIRIAGALFSEEINLRHVKLERQLWLELCRFEGSLYMMNFHINDWFSLEGSWLGGELDLNGARLNSFVSFNNVEVTGAVDMVSVRVGGNLEMSGSKFLAKLDMNSIKVEGSLYLRDKAEFEEIDMISARVDNCVDLSKGIFKNTINMDGITVGTSVFARDATFNSKFEINLAYAHIGSTLDFSGASLGSLNLASTTISAGLNLGSGKLKEPIWAENSTLVLWNTSVKAVQDAGAVSWPDNLELEGFTYSLGGLGTTNDSNILLRKSKEFINWLERDKTFSPQPYEYLAKVLSDAGFPSKANDVRHAARVRSRKEALVSNQHKKPEYWRWFGLLLLQSTIGFGLGTRYFRVLIWLLAFALIGFLVLYNSNNLEHRSLFEMAWASFDITLPIITLNNSYEDYIFSDCSNMVKTYFYFQKMIGYILGGFIVAGLAGLTQKNN